MKKETILILVMFCFVSAFTSCKNKLDPAEGTLFYYGRSPIGTTYKVPVELRFEDGQTARFEFYSTDPMLKAGEYAYQAYDDDFHDCRTWRDRDAYTDMTFYEGLNTFNGRRVVGGKVTVGRDGDVYSLLFDVTDVQGNVHQTAYTGALEIKNATVQSSVGGSYAAAFLEKESPPEGYNGCTFIQLGGGDQVEGMTLSFIIPHLDEYDLSGTYQLPTSQSLFCPRIKFLGEVQFISSGTLIVTRVNKPWAFRFEIDAVTEEGTVVQGVFDGGEILYSGYSF